MPFESIESNFIEIRIAHKTWKCRLENVVNIWFKSRWVKTEHYRSFITGRPIVARQNNVLHFEIKLQWRDSERDGAWNPQSLDCLDAQIKENIKAPHHWPLLGEFTSDQWIPRTKDQWHGKCFHLMTSSWTAQQQPMPNIAYTLNSQGAPQSCPHWLVMGCCFANIV